MSFLRLVYYSAITGGWAAFVGWLVAEFLVMGQAGAEAGGWRVTLEVLLVAGIVGAAIGAGLNIVAGMNNVRWKTLPLRILAGCVVGGLGGALGGLLGNLFFVGLGGALEGLLGNPFYVSMLSRALGFMILGVGVGCVDGLYGRSFRKLRNGVIGGAVGGLLGGILFDPLAAAMTSGTGMSSRATAFVILGICVGALIGTVNVILRDAWLTVLDGYRPGRQLILEPKGTTLGRADYLPLPFLGPPTRISVPNTPTSPGSRPAATFWKTTRRNSAPSSITSGLMVHDRSKTATSSRLAAILCVSTSESGARGLAPSSGSRDRQTHLRTAPTGVEENVD